MYLTSSGTVGNMVEGDSIWSNTVDGVCFTNGASDTFITGSLISTNGNNGVEVDATRRITRSSPTTSNAIRPTAWTSPGLFQQLGRQLHDHLEQQQWRPG